VDQIGEGFYYFYSRAVSAVMSVGSEGERCSNSSLEILNAQSDLNSSSDPT